MELESFVHAVRSGKPALVEQWSHKARAVMVTYLQLRFTASSQDAEDCTQEVLLRVVTLVQEGNFEADNYGGYILTMLRNEYIKMMKEQARTTPDYVLEEHYYTAGNEAVERLTSEEMTHFLHQCIQQLKGISRRIVEYYLKFPDMRAIDIAKSLNISPSNIWTRRHRIHTKLLECIKNKM
ncbi:MAG: RNA polymerase sigma factor [Cyclonatronaceae bacterium]